MVAGLPSCETNRWFFRMMPISSSLMANSSLTVLAIAPRNDLAHLRTTKRCKLRSQNGSPLLPGYP